MQHPRSAPPIVCRRRIAGLSRWWLLPVLMAGALGWVLTRPTFAPVAAVARHPLMHTVVASGRVETRSRTHIASALAGTVREVLVDDGQEVASGAPLARLDDREARALLAQAEAGVRLAQARLERLTAVSLPLARRSEEQARIALQQARRLNANDDRLRASGSIGEEQHAQSGETLALRQSQLEAAVAQTRALDRGGQERALAEAEVRQATASREVAAARLALLTVTAPADGRILRRDVEPGQVVQASTSLFLFVPARPARIVVQIDEKNIADIRVGQTARVKPDAFPTRDLTARVSRIAPAVDADRGAVEIDLAVEDATDVLREDMTVSAEILIADKPDALTLDSLAVRDLESGSPWVWRVVEGRVSRRPVTIGARGNGALEITGGLAEGDLAIAAPTLSLDEGEPVRTGPRKTP